MHPRMKYIVMIPLCILVKLGCITLLRSGFPAPRRCKGHFSLPYHFLLAPGPRSLPWLGLPRTWGIGFLPPTRMKIEATKHCQLSWLQHRRRMGGTRPEQRTHYPGPQHRPFSLSLFHQLRYLDMFRRDIIEALPQEVGMLSRHNLNYVRQMSFCRTDLAEYPVLGREPEAEVRAVRRTPAAEVASSNFRWQNQAGRAS